MSFYEELKRRNVARVAVLYVIASWLILQIADVAVSLLGLPEWVGKTVFLFLGLGFPLALIFSWVYEMTPEGLKKDEGIDHGQSIKSGTGRRINVLIIVMLALAIAVVVADRLIPETTTVVDAPAPEAVGDTDAAGSAQLDAVKAASDHSIAVLPFVNMSDDAGNEFFSDGISEEVLNLLAQIPELRVISRSSAFSFKGKDIRLTDVARELNVVHILEGSVRKAGDQVRITAQLIDARSDTHLWSETYDRKLDNIFQIQDEIAASVVEALRITLLGEAPRTRRIDQESYAFFLQARFFWNRRGTGDEEKAMEYYQQALDIDPGYAPAWAGLSVTYAVQALDGRIDRETGLAKAREAAEMALSLDPDLSDAHVRMAQAYVREKNVEAGLGEIQQALNLDPNSPLALGVMAQFLRWEGRLDEAIKLYRRAATVDPLGPIWHGNMAGLLIMAGRLDEAEDATLKAIELSPGSNYREHLAAIYFWRGQFDEALELTESFSESADKTFGLVVTYGAMGRHDESDAAMNRLINYPGMQRPFLIAQAYASRGETDKAFEWLDTVLETNNLRIGHVRFEPFLKNLHDDPRWDALLDSLE